MLGLRKPRSVIASSGDRRRTFKVNSVTARFISLDPQGTYTATVYGVEIPVMVDCHVCTWVEVQASAMCKDPNVNLTYEECLVWIHQNWLN